MDDDQQGVLQYIENSGYIVNITCDHGYVPSAIEFIESLGTFGIIFVSLGTILMAVTLYLAVDRSYTVILTKETKSYKGNVLTILFIYPVASLCSLVALAIPRAQLLSEAITQTYLAISLYHLYLLLIDVGRREVKKSPSLKLRVGPCCCCLPCLPFPDLEMNPTNLSWLQIIVLQLPIVQTLIYCVFSFMSVENPSIAARYGIFFQPLSITSVLLGLYGLTITTMSLQEVNSGSNIRYKTAVVQMVLLFSKLQGFIIKSFSGTGLFPCNPPITPQVYANFTYNALMLIEMLFLCYAARCVYENSHENVNDAVLSFPENPANNSSSNDAVARIRDDGNRPEIISDLDRSNRTRNNNESTDQFNNRLAGV